MSKRLIDSVTTVIGRVLPKAQVIPSKTIGYKGRKKIKLSMEGTAIKVVVQDPAAGQRELYVHATEPVKALNDIRNAFRRDALPLAA